MGDKNELRQWGDAEIKNHSGVNTQQREVTVTTATGAIGAVSIAFDELSHSREVPDTHYVLVIWELGSHLVGAELSYQKLDPRRGRHENALLELIRSLRPL